MTRCPDWKIQDYRCYARHIACYATSYFRESSFLIFAIFTTEFLSPALMIGGKAVCNIILRHFLFSDVVCVPPFSLYVNVYCRSFLN